LVRIYGDISLTSFLAALSLVVGLVSPPLAAMESAPEPGAAALEATPEKPDTGLDPTVQTSKLGLQSYFKKEPHASYLYQFILKGTYAFDVPVDRFSRAQN